ncbi:MAG: ATP-binding cassette domain-containing protein [Bifidobacteriaceae bacterium]|jgi:peptide/nickel transport system ATP-binding protein|nr:ATP-binding cassette domain-containing protein [Bifidobacteriaceae bacterium]
MGELAIRDLSVTYGRGGAARTVVKHADLVIPQGKVIGLVGESGSGKSTVARAILGLVKPSGGVVTMDGVNLASLRAAERARRVQMIFQDPYGSLNPRMTVGQIVAEALSHRGLRPAERRAEVLRLLELVSMSSEVVPRLPRRLSGGQRQRVAIARAFAAQPDVIVADEITSALDVSVQAQVLNVLREILASERHSMLFISHNLAVVRYICDHVAVMQEGVIVEQGDVEQVMGSPQHDYTRALLAAVPRLV